VKKDKKARLERSGWKVGEVREFLKLSDVEVVLVEFKLALSRGLRQRRTEQKLTQAELARLVRSSQSRVAKMEAGDPTVSIDLLVRSFLAMGATRKELGRIIANTSR